MDPGSYSTRPAIEDFNNYLEQCTISTPPPPLACGRPYVRVSKLKKWLNSETDFRGDKTTQTTRLLEYAYHKWDNVTPIGRSTLFQEGNPCILVFVILLTMDWGWLVHYFHSIHLSDAKLPIDLATLRTTFSEMADRKILKRSDPPPEVLADLFYKNQWQFYPARFNGGYDEYWVKDRIIPIHKKVLISDKGGTAKLWQIAVLEEFIGKKLQQLVPHARYDDKKDDLGPRYHFALKVFDDHNSQIFEHERTAFDTLHEHNGLVQYLGGYTHPVIHTSPAQSHNRQAQAKQYQYNILLEYGDRDLGLLFAEKLPPVLQDDIQSFWLNLFTVAKAVKDMHNFKINNDGITKTYSGWHADIKPDNILEIQGKFRLADPGFAKFVERAKESSESDPVTYLTGGTHTFGAPERYPGRIKPDSVNQTTDTWSLGCVFSIAATWVVLGKEGIKQYQRLRSKGIENLIREQNNIASSSTSPLRLERGDYFHGGFDVLPEVSEWHTYLRHSVRIADKITCLVLDLLGQQNGMLVADPRRRMKSKEVCKQLDLISEGLSNPVSNVPTAISDFLRDGDDQNLSLNLAPSSVRTITESTEPKGPRQERRDKFLNFLGEPLMDNYRSYLKPATVRPPFQSDDSHPRPSHDDRASRAMVSFPGGGIPGPGFQEPNMGPGTPFTLRRPGTMTTMVSGLTDLSRDSKLTRSKKEHPQDVFQAREDMRAKELRRRERDVLARLKSKPKDSTLANYWGDRDLKFIVDNAESMITHWGKVKFVLETLLLKAEGLDPDGVDLTFTLGDVKVNPSKDKTIEKIMKKLDNEEAKPDSRSYTSMQTPLQQIFDEYLRRSKTFDTKKNKITIIVLTDGIWKGMMNKEEVNETIISFARKLEKKLGRPPKERPVSVEFVQFGKDPEATFRLKRLDNELKNEGIIDIVDTEHCDGDVNKMLLGSFVEAYDEMEDDEEFFDSTPSAYRNSYISDQYSNAEQSSMSSPGPLPRSQTLQTQTGSSDHPETWTHGERPNAMMHKHYNSQ